MSEDSFLASKNDHFDLTKEESERHLHILEKSVLQEDFDGSHVKGEFKEPALIFSLNSYPPRAVANTISNLVGFTMTSNDYNLYLYSREIEEGIGWGKIDNNIEHVHLLHELLTPYGLEILEVKDGEIIRRDVLDFIETLRIG